MCAGQLLSSAANCNSRQAQRPDEVFANCVGYLDGSEIRLRDRPMKDPEAYFSRRYMALICKLFAISRVASFMSMQDILPVLMIPPPLKHSIL